MPSPAIGKRNLDLLILADVELYDPVGDTTSTVYWSNRSFLTNVDDSVAANRQYIGLLAQCFQIDYSWFSGDTLGGRSTRNFGALRAINPDGAHSLNYIFEDGLKVQGRVITYRIGRVGDDLATMITYTLTGRHIRQSEDGHEVVIDLSDDGQALDTSVFIDKFQGLGGAVRHAPTVTSSIPDHADLDPTSGWYLDVAYRLPSWATLPSGLEIVSRAATGGGHIYRLELLDTGFLRVSSRTSADATVTLTTDDLQWVADGRWHRLIGKWDDTTDTLRCFHSTRTGGALSEVTAAQTSIKASTSALLFGDVGSTLGTHEYVDIALVAFGTNGDVPTDAEILDRMKRPLTDVEVADCELYLPLDELTGTTATDETGNGHDATVPNAWVQSFEGPSEMAGSSKPLAYGRIFNAPPIWTDRENGAGVVHAVCFKGAVKAYEGAKRLSIGWPKYLFRGVSFEAAGDTITYDTRNLGGADRLDAQPGFAGLLAGQEIEIVGTFANDGTYTLAADSTDRVITVTGGLTDESVVDAYITANADGGDPPDVSLWFDAGAVLFTAVPTFPVSFELLGDVGAEIPTGDLSTHFPEYTAAIMRYILQRQGGIAAGDIAENWDDGESTPDVVNDPYFSHAGVWLDPSRDRTIRDVLDEGAATLWARWGQALANDEWNLFPITAPSGTADIDLGALEILSLRRLRSIPPVGGIVLRSTINYAPLREGEVTGAADAADAAALRREFLEGKAAIDSTVSRAYPFAETPPPITTWLRYQEDARTAAQERYDVLKVEREMYDAEAILYGLDQNPLSALLTLTDEDFGTLASGKDFHLVHFQANDEATTSTGWG